MELAWPNGKKVAVSVTVMFETWSEGHAPSYSVQTTHLKPGTVDHASKAWSTYGGRVGVWRIIRMLDRLQIPGTFFTSARCIEEYPAAVKQIVKSGHDLGGHSYTQDQLLAYMTVEQQEATIRRSVDMLQAFSARKVTGWASPVVAFTPETAGLLVKAGLTWTTDVTYADLPIKLHTPHGVIAGVPTTDFSDNRVMRASPRDLFDVYKGTFDYLYANEPLGLLVFVIHCQFGGRPLITAVLQEVLQYIAQFPDVWFARHEELGRWALAADVDEHTYQSRFFAGDTASVKASTPSHRRSGAGG
jgi:peptidoglycan/xylan/chitin deacetylase (PgdA/CDA1 family)